MTITNEDIARDVMGWDVGSRDCWIDESGIVCYWHKASGKAMHDFLHDMSAAMEVVAEMDRQGFKMRMFVSKKVCVNFVKRKAHWPEVPLGFPVYDNPATAICEAAHKAVTG